jgi:hypothetical protein
VSVVVADLDEDAAACQQISSYGEAGAEVLQVRVDAELPRVSKRADLFGLARRVLDLPVLYVSFARRDLPLDPNLIPYGGSK